MLIIKTMFKLTVFCIFLKPFLQNNKNILILRDAPNSIVGHVSSKLNSLQDGTRPTFSSPFSYIFISFITLLGAFSGISFYIFSAFLDIFILLSSNKNDRRLPNFLYSVYLPQRILLYFPSVTSVASLQFLHVRVRT